MARELTKLSRSTKRLLLMGLALGFIKDKHQYGSERRALLDAQGAAIAFKNKRPEKQES